MASTINIIKKINSFSISDRLSIIEEILKKIKEDSILVENKISKNKSDKSGILKFSGILNTKEAEVFDKAVKDSRKVDTNEW